MRNFGKKIWGVLGKQQSFVSNKIQGQTIPLNANPLEPWDVRKSRYKRVDLVPKVEQQIENIQQGGVVETTPIVPPIPSPSPTSVTPTVTPTNTSTPTQTPTNTPTPTVTPTEPYDVYQFEECNNISNVFRYENVVGSLNVGDVYLIAGGAGFNGYATVVTYGGVGTLYTGAGVTFTLQGACPTPTPTPTPTQTTTPTETPTSTPTETPTNTPTETPTNTPTNTPTPTETTTPSPTETTTPTPTETPTSTPTPTSSPIPANQILTENSDGIMTEASEIIEYQY
jgi:hypothetical protein